MKRSGVAAVTGLRAVWIVFAKEVVDALRDRRTLAAVLVSAVLMGPLALLALSGLVGTLEAEADRREVYVAGAPQAPSLENYLRRQSYVVKTPPTDFEAALRSARLGAAVIVVPAGFEASLARGESPRLEVVSDSANQRSLASASRCLQLLAGFGRERAALTLALRGVAPQLLEPVDIGEKDLASSQTRATRVTGMLPFFVVMAVLYGALTAAIDTTAGERERGSLEPLLMTPADRRALVLGKWSAVAAVAMLIAVLSCLSFLPGQWLLRSDTLTAMFQYGSREALLFLVVLLPFAAALSALLMAVAIRCRTVKEAQAATSIVVLGASLLPLISIFGLGQEAGWYVWVPALAQNALMTRVLKGESLGLAQAAIPLGVCIAITVVCVVDVARRLRAEAVR